MLIVLYHTTAVFRKWQEPRARGALEVLGSTRWGGDVNEPENDVRNGRSEPTRFPMRRTAHTRNWRNDGTGWCRDRSQDKSCDQPIAFGRSGGNGVGLAVGALVWRVG
jgi:hypothetical protein